MHWLTTAWNSVCTVTLAVGVVWNRVRAFYEKMKPILTPMINEAEQRALDGVIDKEDRKAIVMVGINAAEADGQIKLNWIEKLIIGKVVDYISEKLPSWVIDAKTGNPVPK